MSQDLQLFTPEPPSARAAEVLQQINLIKQSMIGQAIELGHLLKEAKENSYHRSWGYANFGDWVESSSGLDLSARQGFYLISIVAKAEALQISDETLKGVEISKLKRIFSLSVEDGETIKGLLESAPSTTLAEINEQVGKIRGGSSYVFKTIKLAAPDEVEIFDDAIERVRREHGGYQDEEGNPVDITESKAIMFLAADYLANPVPEEFETEGIIEAQFEDVFEELS